MGESKVYYIRESLIQSVLADVATFGFLAGSVWFSVKFCGNNYFLNGVILIMFLFFIIGKISGKTKKFNTNEELIKYLQKEPQ